MQISRAFSYVFEDPDWLGKLVLVLVFTFLSAILTPLLFLGLLPLCVLLGYMLSIINNVRDEQKVSLPRWVEFEKLLSRGAGVLAAIIVYNLPFLLFGCCIFASQGSFQDEAINGLVVLLTVCCIAPLAITYGAFSGALLAAGITEYARTYNTGDFFKVGRLWNKVQAHGALTIQYLLATLIVNLVFAIVAPIPCIGWIAAPAMLIPIHAHLLGQYARHTDHSPRPKKR